MTLEQRLKMMLGEQQWAIAALMSQVDALTSPIKDPEKTKPENKKAAPEPTEEVAASE